MSEIGDMYEQMREESKKVKAKRLKWNTDVVLFLAEDLDFKITQHSEYHFSLFHVKKGRMDYWPSTQKACWYKNNRPGKTFRIPDIEQYIFNHFK
jgi:hypothetical protein